MHTALDPLLVRQHGLVTRSQAWQHGLSDRQVDHLLVRGLLVPVHRSVFRDPASPITLEQGALGAVLACGAGSVSSHRTSIAIWGMKNYQCSLLETTTRGRRRHPGIVTHQAVRTVDQTVVRGVPVTTPARTLIDVATLVNRPLLQRWVETWLASKTVTLDDLDAQIARLKHHPGAAALRAALEDRTLIIAAADSPPEATLGLVLQKHGMPPLTLHHVVTTTTGSVYELDWSYPQWRIAFEMDGFGVHMRSLEAFEHDRFRRNELEIDGWTVLNFTKRQVERRSRAVVDQVARLIQRRALSA